MRASHDQSLHAALTSVEHRLSLLNMLGIATDAEQPLGLGVGAVKQELGAALDHEWNSVHGVIAATHLGKFKTKDLAQIKC